MPALSAVIGHLDNTKPLPLYQQLERMLRQAIYEKRILPDDALPAEREIAEEFSVSRITIRKALDGLVDEGLLVRKPGAGTFVSTRFEKTFSKLTSFTEDMALRGWTPRTVWLDKDTGTVTPKESLRLGLGPGITVYRYSRIRYADEVPMAIEYSTIPAAYLSSLESVESSLYGALDQHGHRPVRALQRLRAVLFSPEQKKLLGISTDEAGLLIERHGFLENGQTVEFTQSYYRGDAYDFIAELNV